MTISSHSCRPLLTVMVCLGWISFIASLPFVISPQTILLKKEAIQHDIGCAYTVHIKQSPVAWPLTEFKGDNLLSSRVSELSLLENGQPVGYPHALHASIRDDGNGLYSHWGKAIYFSASDCSNPINNGMTYEVMIPVSISIWAVISCFIAAYIAGIQLTQHFPRSHETHKKMSNIRINWYFIASFVTVISAVLIKFPSLVTSAEFYAETATIFFKEARESDFWGILTYVWADYLVTFQLLVSFLLVRVFGLIEYFPAMVNFLFLLFIAFSVSLINLRVFRTLVESDFLRFMIGLSIGLTPNLELYQLLNSNLFGMMIFLLFIFVEKKQFNRWFFYFLTILLFLVGISRPNTVAFLPIYIVLLGIAIKARHIRDIIFYTTGSASLFLQSYVMIMAQLYWSPRKKTGIYNEISGIDSLFSPLEATLNHYFRTLLGVIFNRQISGLDLIVGLIFVIMVLIIAVCCYMYHKKRFLILYYFLLSQILAFGMIYFITFSSPIKADWNTMYYDMMRWWVYSNYIIYLSLIVLAYNAVQEFVPAASAVIKNHIFARMSQVSIKNELSRISVITFAILAVLFQIYPFYQSEDPYDKYNSLSDWKKYHHLLDDLDYYIPINPVMDMQWAIRRDNEKINSDIKLSEPVSKIYLSDTEGELKLRSILLINHHYYRSMDDLIIKAYDKAGNEISIIRHLNDFKDRYLYFYPEERIRPYSLAFFNSKMQSVIIRPEIHLFGKIDTNEHIVITGELY